MLTLQLPTQIAALADGRRLIQLEATSAQQAFQALDAIAPMVRSQIFDKAGSVRQFIGLFINDEQVHDASELEQVLQPGSSILVVQSVAGG